MAEKDRQLFILGKNNEEIDCLLTGGNSLVNLADVEKMEARTRKTTQLFKVTSAYLLINNQRLNRGEPIWIIDVSGATGFPVGGHHNRHAFMWAVLREKSPMS